MAETFHVSTVQDYPAFQVMVRVWIPLYHPTKGWWFYLGGGVLGVLLCLLLNFNGLSLPLAWGLRAAIVVICLLLARPARRGLERRLCRTVARRTYIGSRNRDARVEYRFEPGRILVRDQFGQSQVDYGAIAQAVETEDYFLLFLSEQVCHILSKSGFEQGSPARFGPFLAKTCGKPLRTFSIPGAGQTRRK